MPADRSVPGRGGRDCIGDSCTYIGSEVTETYISILIKLDLLQLPGRAAPARDDHIYADGAAKFALAATLTYSS